MGSIHSLPRPPRNEETPAFKQLKTLEERASRLGADFIRALAACTPVELKLAAAFKGERTALYAKKVVPKWAELLSGDVYRYRVEREVLRLDYLLSLGQCCEEIAIESENEAWTSRKELRHLRLISVPTKVLIVPLAPSPRSPVDSEDKCFGANGEAGSLLSWWCEQLHASSWNKQWDGDYHFLFTSWGPAELVVHQAVLDRRGDPVVMLTEVCNLRYAEQPMALAA